MAITATSKNNTPRELIPAGNYVARCIKMIEIGTVPKEYLGVEKMQHLVQFIWELPTEMKVFNPEKGEQPCAMDKEYTLSLADKANLTRDLNSWRGKAFTPQEADNFDVTKLLGVPCMLNIIHKAGKKDPTKFYEQISSISPLPKGLVCPPQITPTFVFELDTFDSAKFDILPQYMKDKIVQSNEYKAFHGEEVKEILVVGAVDAYLEKEDPDEMPF